VNTTMTVTGWAQLVRFGFRRDRVRLSVWIAALTLAMVYTPNAIRFAYPDMAQRQSRVDLLKTPAGIMLSGPMFGGDETDLGAMMANELMLTLIVAASILAIQNVVRHTRADEESGAAELVLSSAVGRHAPTAAALSIAGAVNVILTIAMTVAMASAGFAVTDTAAMCIGVTSVAMFFAAITATAAQLWQRSRTVKGASLAVLGAAMLARGAGDVISNSGSALSWVSPIAWAQQMRPFVGLRWWPLALLIVSTIALIGLAAILQARREFGAALLSFSSQHPDAPPIRGVFGLYMRLERGQTIGWATALLLSGLVFGSMTKSLLNAARGNPLLERVLAADGIDGVYTTMTQFLAAGTTAYVVTVISRIYRDEESGIGEAVLSGAVSRWTWLLAGFAAAVFGAFILLLCAGFGNGLGAGLTLGEPGTILRLTVAALAYLPAMAVVGGIATIGVALRRPVIGWSGVLFVVLTLYIGALLRLPRWLIDLSPVNRVAAPASISIVVLVTMTAIAAAAAAIAGAIYRRRDGA
jgi:ABC-2 type transport system permease protein